MDRTGLEAMLVNKFDLVVDTELRKFVLHKGGVICGGSINGRWNAGGEFFRQSYVFWAEFDIEIVCGGVDDFGGVLAKQGID